MFSMNWHAFWSIYLVTGQSVEGYSFLGYGRELIFHFFLQLTIPKFILITDKQLGFVVFTRNFRSRQPPERKEFTKCKRPFKDLNRKKMSSRFI